MPETQQDKILFLLASLSNLDFLHEAETVDALFMKLHEWTEPWAKPNREVSTQQKVIDALNPKFSDWVSNGVPTGEIPLWSALNMKSRDAGRWVKAGLSVLDAFVWSEFNFRNKLDPSIVAGWELRSDEIERGEITHWVDQGIPASPGVEWFKAGWGDAAMSYDAKTWMTAFPEGNPSDLLVNFLNERTISSVRRWNAYGIVGEELEQFDSKGYSPARAAKMLVEGLSSSDAPIDFRRSNKEAERIQGNSWKQIWNKASKGGWRIVRTDRRPVGRVGVVLRDMNDTFEVRVLMKNGKFIDSYVRRKHNNGFWSLSDRMNRNEVLKFISLNSVTTV